MLPLFFPTGDADIAVVRLCIWPSARCWSPPTLEQQSCLSADSMFKSGVQLPVLSRLLFIFSVALRSSALSSSSCLRAMMASRTCLLLVEGPASSGRGPGKLKLALFWWSSPASNCSPLAVLTVF